MSPAIDDLLLPLIEGVFEEPPWQLFLERLRVRVDASYASFIFRAPPPARPSLVHLYAGEAWSPALEQLYRDRLHAQDPVQYHQLVAGRVYAIDELLDPANPAHQAYYRDVLRPSGTGRGRLIRVVEPGGLNIWLSICRSDRDFTAADSALLAALAPYLRAALRSYAAVERARYDAALAGDAIRRLNYGWLTLDAEGRVLEADAQAHALLDHSGVLRRDAGGHLSARPAELGRDIAAAIRAMASDLSRAPRALILSRDPWLDMLLLRASRRPLGPGAPPALIAYIHGDSWSSADRCGQLAELFRLQPSEARLALALGRGLSIAEAASELRLTIETARTYSKRIYAKTGARGQPDLVRFIHKSILAIA